MVPEPFVLHPLPRAGGRCPHDGAHLEQLRLHLPGWRLLIEGTCVACGHRILHDLPSGHGLVYPTALDLDTGDTVDLVEAAWFAQWLKPGYETPDLERIQLTVERRNETVRPFVVNCLDPVYGHALLKLLGARSFSGGLGGTDGCVAIVPRALAPLAPKFIDELWVVECRVGELNEWLSALDVQLRAELERFEIARLATVPPHPHPSTYDLMDLAPHALPERSGAPSIVLSLRDDRRWGAQEDNVAQLLAALAEVFPRVGVAAVGPGTPGGLPDQVLDMRDPSPSAERESRWVSLMRGADLAVGVHGSNLLLPSGLAAATVEIVPRSRYPNLFQATLMAEHDPLLALDRHRVVYADEDMSDISGSRVALVAIPLLQGMTRFAQLMTGSAAGVGVEPLIRLDPGAPPPTPPPVARSQIDRVKAMIAGLLDRLGRRSDSDGTTEREFEAALLAGLEGRLVEVLDLNDARNGPGDARRKVEAAWEAGNSVHRLDKALTAIRVAGPLMHPVRAVALRDDSSE